MGRASTLQEELEWTRLLATLQLEQYLGQSVSFCKSLRTKGLRSAHLQEWHRIPGKIWWNVALVGSGRGHWYHLPHNLQLLSFTHTYTRTHWHTQTHTHTTSILLDWLNFFSDSHLQSVDCRWESEFSFSFYFHKHVSGQPTAWWPKKIKK